MILSVLAEVIEYRGRAPRLLLSNKLLVGKALLLLASIITPLALPVPASLMFALSLLTLLFVLGLRLSSLYVGLSGLFLYASMYLSALIFNGSFESVARFCLTAMSTLSVFILIASTTPPSALRRWPFLYILVVVFSSVLREIIDISVVHKAKGSSGLRYWLRIVTAGIAASLTRAEALSDSLMARGVELED